MQQFSSAYDPRIYEFFFTRQTGNTDEDIILEHNRFEPDTPLEIDELKAAALDWQGLPPPPEDVKVEWTLKRYPQRGHEKERLEYAIMLPNREYLFLTIQGR